MLDKVFAVVSLVLALGCGDNTEGPQPDNDPVGPNLPDIGPWRYVPLTPDAAVVVAVDAAVPPAPDAEVVPVVDASVPDAEPVVLDASLEPDADQACLDHMDDLGNGHYKHCHGAHR